MYTFDQLNDALQNCTPWFLTKEKNDDGELAYALRDGCGDQDGDLFDDFAGVLDDLADSRPEGMETAYQWLEAAAHFQDSDPVTAAVCKASALFHDGSYSAEQLIDDLTSEYTPRQLARAYKMLTEE